MVTRQQRESNAQDQYSLSLALQDLLERIEDDRSVSNAGKANLFQYIQGLLSDDVDVRPEQVNYVSSEFEALKRRVSTGGAKRKPAARKPAARKPAARKPAARPTKKT